MTINFIKIIIIILIIFSIFIVFRYSFFFSFFLNLSNTELAEISQTENINGGEDRIIHIYRNGSLYVEYKKGNESILNFFGFSNKYLNDDSSIPKTTIENTLVSIDNVSKFRNSECSGFSKIYSKTEIKYKDKMSPDLCSLNSPENNYMDKNVDVLLKEVSEIIAYVNHEEIK